MTSGRSAVAVAMLLALVVSPAAARAADTPSAACVEASDAGQAAREQNELKRAREAFTACAADQCPRALRVDCAKWLEDVDRDIPTVVVGVKDEQGADVLDAQVTIDGEPAPIGGAATPLDPGVRVFRFERPGAPAHEKRIVVRTGERNRLVVEQIALPGGGPARRVEPAPAAPEPGLPTGTWILGGVGALSLGGFALLGGLGRAEKDDLHDMCGQACSDEQVAGLRRLYIGADVALGVAVVAFAAATVIALTSSPTKAPSKTAFTGAISF